MVALSKPQDRDCAYDRRQQDDHDDEAKEKLKAYMIKPLPAKKARMGATASYSIYDDLPEDDDEAEMAATNSPTNLQVRVNLKVTAYMAHRVKSHEQKMCGDEDEEFNVLKWRGLVGVKTFRSWHSSHDLFCAF
ncbi:hypothetical protein M5K25_019126 [Dendrobium thyrsiflorum]|uniref:Uncharacterized protein n=1 Tax=Dendrobium thyrsiflorum TaxID=117978 RepID=A0ABD0ULA3_DENTH